MAKPTEKTETRKEALNRLFKENGLLPEDYFEHKHYKIITRSGIEKIQYKNGIEIEYEAVHMAPDFCVVLAKAQMERETKTVRVQTFGSAGHGAKGEPDQGKVKTNQYMYYPEIAEKRSKSRAVLMITDFYKYGVFGEDEADDFAQQNNQPKKVLIEKPQNNGPTPTDQVVYTKTDVAPETLVVAGGHDTVDPDGVGSITPKQKERIELLLDNEKIKPEEKTKMVLALPNLSINRATEATNKLRDTILERGGKLPAGTSALSTQ